MIEDRESFKAVSISSNESGSVSGFGSQQDGEPPLPGVVVYADKHKTRKYSVRCRLITARGVINAKAVGYDPTSATKELIARLDRQIKSEHSEKVKGRQHRESARKM